MHKNLHLYHLNNDGSPHLEKETLNIKFEYYKWLKSQVL